MGNPINNYETASNLTALQNSDCVLANIHMFTL